MPHDKNGVRIKQGDIVKGRGYNLGREVIGPAVGIGADGSGTCNVAVAHPVFTTMSHGVTEAIAMVRVDVEYGTAREFEIVKAVDNRALEADPPEPEAQPAVEDASAITHAAE